jgi:NAD(P)-dependent dehydrogenase (short-subunit alcohol dehydrogenase family)
MESPKGAVLITGASTGIGAACAVYLATLGFRVFAGVRRLADAQALGERTSGTLTPLLLDITNETSISRAASEVGAAVGAAGLYGLVNNAGVVVASPLEILPPGELRRQLEVNVVGQLAVTQAFLPLLRQARGRLVNIGSISGRSASPVLGPYAASKAALAALTHALRLELKPWGIHVSLIEPGAVATPIWEKSKTAGEELARRAPAEGYTLYAGLIVAVQKAAGHAARRAIPAQIVAEVVAHALTTPKPKTRYVVGRDAKIQAVAAWLLPDRLRDRLLAKVLRLPGG